MSQEMVEKTEVSDDERKTRNVLARELLAVSSSADDETLTVYCFEITTEVESPSLGMFPDLRFPFFWPHVDIFTQMTFIFRSRLF